MTTWTTPKTWTATTLAVSDMNTHVRDNLNHLYERSPIYSIAKASDESLNTNTTPQNDNDLVWAIAANEVWSFRLMLYVVDAANGAADIKTAWTVPASTTMAWGHYSSSIQGGMIPVTSGVAPQVVLTEASTNTWGLTTGNVLLIFEGLVFASSTAGNVQFQWAQGTSNGSNLTVKKGSNLLVAKLV